MKYVFAAMVGYAAGWTITYVALMRGDFRYFFEYLQLAWTRPGELPTFINLGALAAAFIVPLGLWGYSKLR